MALSHAPHGPAFDRSIDFFFLATQALLRYHTPMTLTLNDYYDLAIPLDPRDGGALDWFDRCDEEHRVILVVHTTPEPSSPAAREKWLRETLCDLQWQSFYFYPNTHKNMALQAEVLATGKIGFAGHCQTVLRIPLAHIHGLPNENPKEELAQLREFFEFIDARGAGQRDEGGDASLQWYRSGYGNRGLDWVGFKDEAVGEACKKELESWLEKPILKEWKARNLAGWGKLRNGPHCWATMPSLVPDRRWQRILEESQLPAESKKPKGP